MYESEILISAMVSVPTSSFTMKNIEPFPNISNCCCSNSIPVIDSFNQTLSRLISVSIRVSPSSLIIERFPEPNSFDSKLFPVLSCHPLPVNSNSYSCPSPPVCSSIQVVVLVISWSLMG